MRQVAALVIVDVPDSIQPNSPASDVILDRIEEYLEAAGFDGVYVEPYIGPAFPGARTQERT